MIVYLNDPKDSMRKGFDLIMIKQISLVFLYSSNKLAEKKNHGKIPFMISSKLISTNKAKEVRNLSSENFKALKKEIAVFLQYLTCKVF